MNSSLATQRRLIATSALVTFGIGIYGAYSRDETPSSRFLIGAGFAFTVCSIFADFGIPVGAGFAMLIMISPIMFQGEDVLTSIGKAGKRKSTGKTRSKKSQKKQRQANATGLSDPGDYPRG